MISPWTFGRALTNIRDRVIEGPLADLRRMPRVAIDTGPGDDDAWGVGRSLGLARSGRVSTYRYAVHPTARLRGAPVLLVSPLGACGVAFDLRRGCSLVEHLVGEGRHVHQVDDEDVTGHDTPMSASSADLARWVDDILPHVIRVVSAHHDGAPVHVVGWSVSGLAALLAAAGDPGLPVASVTALAAPFTLAPVPERTPPRPLALAAGGPALATIQTLLGLVPHVPLVPRVLAPASVGTFLTTPLTVLSHLDDRDFLAQLEAVDDLRALVGRQADEVGALFHAMVDGRELATGTVTVGGRAVSLGALTRPVLLVAGEDDVVVPPKAVRHGTALLTSAPTSLTTAPGGHLGVVCGRASRQRLWPALCAFLDRHDPPAEVEGDRRSPRRPRRAVRRPLPAAPRTGPPDPPAPSDAPDEAVTPEGPDEAAPPRRPASRARVARGRPAPKRATRPRGRE